MDNAKRYRQLAQDCIELASSPVSQETRAALLSMADTWMRLAKRCETEQQQSQPKQ
jgi:hypothetical protein